MDAKEQEAFKLLLDIIHALADMADDAVTALYEEQNKNTESKHD